MKEIVLKLELDDSKAKRKALKIVATLRGVDSIAIDIKENKLTVIGKVDPISVISKLRKHWPTTDMILVGPVVEPETEENAKKEEEPSKDAPSEEVPKKEDEEAKKEEQEKEEEKKYELFLELVRTHRGYNHQMPTYYYAQSMEENPNACTIC